MDLWSLQCAVAMFFLRIWDLIYKIILTKHLQILINLPEFRTFLRCRFSIIKNSTGKTKTKITFFLSMLFGKFTSSLYRLFQPSLRISRAPRIYVQTDKFISSISSHLQVLVSYHLIWVVFLFSFHGFTWRPSMYLKQGEWAVLGDMKCKHAVSSLPILLY